MAVTDVLERPAAVAGATSVERLLAEARSRLQRLGPHEAAAAHAAGALLVDIRPVAQRRIEGEIPGSIVIERNVLEWRLAPDSPYRIPELVDARQPVVVVCSEGYTSSLAAAALQDLGLTAATDLDGGFLGWDAAGLPAAAFGWAGVVDRTAPVCGGARR